MPDEIKRAFAYTTAIAEAVREAGRIPSGTVYALMVGHMTLEAYNSAIAILTRAGLVREQNHELIWIGPEIDKQSPTQ